MAQDLVDAAPAHHVSRQAQQHHLQATLAPQGCGNQGLTSQPGALGPGHGSVGGGSALARAGVACTAGRGRLDRLGVADRWSAPSP